MKMLNSSLDLSFIRYSPLTFVCAGGKSTTSNTSLRLANSSAICLGTFGSSMPSSLMGRDYFGGSLSGLILWASIRSCSRLLGILVYKSNETVNGFETSLQLRILGCSQLYNTLSQNCDCQPA